jgi:7,8-dihydropterin-6-yl-methyl-4-(beta-D-ribofuranosyl)aminobenzene 5'-phosphate synthase
VIERFKSEPNDSHLYGPAQLREVDGVRVTILIDNYGDIFMPSQTPLQRHHVLRTEATDSMELGETLVPLRAEHGFAALVEVEYGKHRQKILFDTGVSPTGLAWNLSMLDLDISDISAIVLSHGHFDHTGGLVGLVDKIGVSRLPIILHPHAFRTRRLLTSRGVLELPTMSKKWLIANGIDIIEERHTSYILDGAILITGEVARSTEFETGFGVQEYLSSDQVWQPDVLVLDDQAIIISVKDSGLVVLTGCGHAGVINTCRYAQYLTHEQHIAAVVGGFHLSGEEFVPLLPMVIEEFRAINPDHLIPGHCSGIVATTALGNAMPGKVLLSTVGSSLGLGSFG